MKLQHVANTCMATAKVFKDKVPVSTTVKDSDDVTGYMDKKEPHLELLYVIVIKVGKSNEMKEHPENSGSDGVISTSQACYWGLNLLKGENAAYSSTGTGSKRQLNSRGETNRLRTDYKNGPGGEHRWANQHRERSPGQEPGSQAEPATNKDHKQSQQTRHILNEDQPTPNNTTQFNLIIDI